MSALEPIDPMRDPCEAWDPVSRTRPAPAVVPAPAPGFGPWEPVDERAFHRAWRDDTEWLLITHGSNGEETTTYFVARRIRSGR
ncbi:hypothetical protein QYN14_25620 [Rhodococcus ruber]|uniref:hypothetical protein n=1 Tax=Rhodococcus ruber TaxID=1830 RepID=UPI00265B3ADA|nr:hypothetical protein [Rhodococcus ruber]WKK11928.1 hypothetical protein QYN14_25200 [Rhodococcus ruber]WKK12012.1 hypothetical protein QYN14_25620 [Rhodococcus ruber]